MKNPLPAIKSFLSDNRADIKYILLLLLVSCGYFWKLLVNPGELITSSAVLGNDSIDFFYPMYSYAYQVIQEGGMPWWNPLILAGNPLAANPQFALFYPMNIPFLFLDTATAFSISYILHVFLAGVFMYFLCRHLEMQRICAFFAGIVFMFGGFVTSHIYAGHYTLVCAAIWLPLLFLLFDNSLKKQSLPAAIGAGAVLGIQMLAGHIQITYISLIGLAIYFLYFLFTERNGISISKIVKSTAIPLAMIIIGILLSSVQFLPAYEYSLFSSRAGGMDYGQATTFSLNPGMLSLLFTNPWAGPTALSDDFFVNYFWEFSPYIGILPLILLIFGAYFCWKNSYVGFFFLLSVIAILLAMGSHFPPYWLLYKLAPGFDMFRVPARFIMLFGFSAAILSGYGMEYLKTKLNREQVKETRMIIIALSLFALVIAIIAALPIHKFAVVRSGMIILAVLLMVSGTILYLRCLGRLNSRLFGITAVVFTLSNLWFFHMPFIDAIPVDTGYPPKSYIEYLQNQGSGWRVYDPEAILPKNHLMVYKIPEINGYEASVSGRYEQFFGESSGRIGIKADPVSATIGISNLGNKLDLLSVKYILTSKILQEEELLLRYSDSGVNIYENLDFLPMAHMIPCAQIHASGEEIDAILSEAGFDFSRQILLEDIPNGAKLSNDNSNGECSIISYEPGNIIIEASNSAPGFLFLSEAWYSAWQVFIDGQPGELLVANGAFMSVYLE
ncbi:MAG: hypothetical protein RBT40_10305, partial [Petrimonas sp.]|nr:hypothetical protein [Petrimonas sp.]